MGKLRRIGPIGTIATVAVMLLAPSTAASAQTTTPTTSAQAGSYPVLQTPDLPAGYSVNGGSPFTRTGIAPFYPTISKCVWNGSNRFSGLTPDIFQSWFTRTETAIGQNTAIMFDRPKAAAAFLGNFEDAHRRGAKCKLVKVPASSDPSTLVDYGTMEIVDAGELGDESFGVTLTPSSAGFPAVQYAYFRTGSTFGVLQISDDDLTAKDFKKLAKVAEKRAS